MFRSLILAVLITLPVQAQELDGQHLVTAHCAVEISRAGVASARFYLGTYRLVAGGALERDHFVFRPELNSFPTTTGVNHPPLRGYRPVGNARPAPIRYPRPHARLTGACGRWSFDAPRRVLALELTDGHRETWTETDQARGLFRLDRSTPIAAGAISGAHTHGYGIRTPEPRASSRLVAGALRPSYQGKVVYKPRGPGLTDAWRVSESSFNPSRFATPRGRSDLLFLTTAEPGGTPIQNTMLLAPAPLAANPSLFVREYGRDSNNNRAYDDLGHEALYWAVVKDGKVDAMVGVQYSYQNYRANDPVPRTKRLPQLGVELYY